MGAHKLSRKSRNHRSKGQLVFIYTSNVFQITGFCFNAIEIKNPSVVTAVEEAATLRGGQL